MLGFFWGALSAAPPDAIVALDGSGQFTSVQKAISAAPMRTGVNDPRWTIFVKAGTYRERLYVQRERGNIALIGEDAATTIITFDLHANLRGPDGQPIGTFRTPTVQIDGDNFVAENLTMANSAGPVGQALALRVDGDRVVFRNCRFLGWQDTILVNRGRHYFADCYIEGHVDFVFGGATAYFERCHLHALKDGYLTAASTPEGTAHGFVFSDGKVTGAEGVRTYLGRPWRNFARTIFLRTEMSDAVRPEGWHNWNKPAAEASSFYAEFANDGSGAAAGNRVAWRKKFPSGAAAMFTPTIVLAGADTWNPDPRPTLHLVGDSTMADKADLEHPERGWGQLLRERMSSSWRLVNHAVNGRSTKSFRDLGLWQNMLNQLHAGDWVVIQFGHNDAKLDDPSRLTDPATEYPANLRRYVAEVRARGAHPILATSVARRKWTDAGELVDTHGAYLAAVRAVATDEKVPLLEMEGATRDLLTKLGPEDSKKSFLIYAPGEHPKFPEGKNDNTHYTAEGARLVADLAVTEFQRHGSLPAGVFRAASSASPDPK